MIKIGDLVRIDGFNRQNIGIVIREDCLKGNTTGRVLLVYFNGRSQWFYAINARKVYG